MTLFFREVQRHERRARRNRVLDMQQVIRTDDAGRELFRLLKDED